MFVVSPFPCWYLTVGAVSTRIHNLVVTLCELILLQFWLVPLSKSVMLAKQNKKDEDLAAFAKRPNLLAAEKNDQNANGLYRMSSLWTLPQMNNAN